MAGTSVVRDRIFDIARRRFYAEGIKSVSADQLIAEAAVAKVTFYRHFPSKDDLVRAYLTAVAQDERTALARQRRLNPENPAAVLWWYAMTIGALSCAPGFRGCPFINAAAEYPDPGHPARRVVQDHRAWLRSQAKELAVQLAVRDPDKTADALLMLRDGAMISGYLDADTDRVAAQLVDAGRAVLIEAGANLH